MKQCTKCKEVKPLEEFNKDKSKKDGLRYNCKSCTNSISKKWYKNNPEKGKANAKSWSKDNPDRVKSNKKNWIKENPEKVKAIDKKWYKNNPEKKKASAKKWSKNNPEKRKVITKKQYESKKEGHFSIYVLEGTQGEYGKGYVGQTNSLYYRIRHHKSNGKIFDSYTILDIAQTREEALYLEAQYHLVGYGGGDSKGSKLRDQIIEENKLKLINN